MNEKIWKYHQIQVNSLAITVYRYVTKLCIWILNQLDASTNGN